MPDRIRKLSEIPQYLSEQSSKVRVGYVASCFMASTLRFGIQACEFVLLFGKESPQ